MAPLLAIIVSLVPTIWIVDASAGPGTNFPDLPAAVAAAQHGDAILVRAGTYSGFTVTGKALTIRGAGSGTTVVATSASIQTPLTSIDNVPAGSVFFINGIAFASNSGPFGSLFVPTYGLRIGGSTTRCVLMDVSVTGHLTSAPTAGLRVEGGVVHAERCWFLGCTASIGGISIGGQAGAGAEVLAGAVLAVDSSLLIGGQGGSGPQSGSAHIGGAGIWANGGTVTITRTSCYGGLALAQPNGAIGGDGLKASAGGFIRASGDGNHTLHGCVTTPTSSGRAAIADAGSAILLHGSMMLFSAQAGGPTSGPVTTGLPPMPTMSVLGTVHPSGELLASQSCVMFVQSSLPFAPFVLGFDLAPGFAPLPPSLALGELLIPFPPTGTIMGSLDGSGAFALGFVPAIHAPGITDLPMYGQVGVFDAAAGQYRVSNLDVHFYRN